MRVRVMVRVRVRVRVRARVRVIRFDQDFSMSRVASYASTSASRSYTR